MGRELGGRERAVGHEHAENLGARLVADERRDARDVGAVPHVRMVAGAARTLRWPSKHAERRAA